MTLVQAILDVNLESDNRWRGIGANLSVGDPTHEIEVVGHDVLMLAEQVKEAGWQLPDISPAISFLLP